MSSTLAELEHKLNVVQLVKDNPWPALALAIGAGVLLSGSRADVKAAAATATATKGASSKIATALDDVVAQLVGGVHSAINQRVDGWVDDLKGVIGSSLANGTSSQRKTQHYGVGPIHDLPDGPAAVIGNTPTRGD